MKNLIAIILIGTSFGLFNMFIDPIYTEVRAMRVQKAEFDDALDNTEKVAGIRDELLTKYNSFSAEDLKRLEKILPNHVDNIRIIIEVDQIASRYNMSLKDVQVAQQAAAVLRGSGAINSTIVEKPYGAANLSFTVAGTYGSFLGFLRDMERSLRIMDIENITVKPADKGGGEYSYEIKLVTYWLKDNQTATTI